MNFVEITCTINCTANSSPKLLNFIWTKRRMLMLLQLSRQPSGQYFNLDLVASSAPEKIAE